MEHDRFDRLSREAARAGTRRQAVRALLVALAGAAGLGARDGAAGCKRVGEGCRSKHACCGGAACIGRRCLCPGNRPTLCGSRCVNLTSSRDHCGACGHRCHDGKRCWSGVCRRNPPAR